jgi:hypothetical protein
MSNSCTNTIYKTPKVVFDLHSSGLLNKQNGEKALCDAAKYNSREVAEALMDCGISPSYHIEINPAFATRGDADVLNLLLKAGISYGKIFLFVLFFRF